MTRAGIATTLDREAFPSLHGPVSLHSVFPSAANVHTRGGLFTLVAASKPAGPRTAVLDIDDLTTLGLRPGDAGELTADRLTLGSLDVDLGPAVSWQPLDLAGAQLRAAAVATLAVLLGECRLGSGPAAKGSDPIPTPFQAAVASELTTRTAEFVGAVGAQNVEGARRAAERLLGLGHGLTPSGDDWLAGFVLAAHVAPERLDVARVAVDAAALPGTTVDLSLSIIRNSLQGRAIDPLHRLLAALTDPSGAEVGEALDRLADVGHSSGVDMALGLLAAAHLTTHPQGAQ